MNDRKPERMSDRLGQFVAVPVSFVNDLRISPRAFRLFVVLRSYTSANDGRDLVFPGYEKLRKRCGFSSYTFVALAIRELEQAGWIERHKRFGKSTHYYITQPVLQTGVEMDAPPVLQTGVASVLHPSVGTVLHPSVDYLEPENKNQSKQEVDRPAPKTSRRVSGFGTVITEHADGRVAAYLSILKPEISAANADLILKRIDAKNAQIWRDVLTLWADRGYNRTGFADMFERYDTLKNQHRIRATSPAPVYANGNGKHAMPDIVDGAREILRQRAAARGETI